MKLFSVVTALTLGSALVVGCNGSNNSLVGVGKDLCAEGYSILPANPVPGQLELSLNPDDHLLVPGVYTYAGSDLYYVDNTTHLQMLVTDSPQSNGAFSPSIGCLRNAKPGMNIAPIAAQGVSGMQVDENFKTLIDTYNFTIAINHGDIAPVFQKSSTQQKDESPVAVYTQSPPRFFKTSPSTDTTFEIHSSGTTTNGTYQLVVRLTRAALPAN